MPHSLCFFLKTCKLYVIKILETTEYSHKFYIIEYLVGQHDIADYELDPIHGQRWKYASKSNHQYS